MEEDIVDRLRNLGKRREMEGIYTDQNICEDAIEEIERMRVLTGPRLPPRPQDAGEGDR